MPTAVSNTRYGHPEKVSNTPWPLPCHHRTERL